MKHDEQVSKNIELVGLFLADLLEHPSALAEQPDRSNIVLIPDDDEALADANMEMARRLISKCPDCGHPLSERESQSEKNDEDSQDGGVFLRPVCSGS